MYREPRADGYADFRLYRIDERVAPLASPELELDLTDLLPSGVPAPEQGQG